MKQKDLIIREAVFDDLQKLRKLRLEALKLHPEAFGGDYETDKKLPLSHWKKNFKLDSMSTIFVAQSGKDLIGSSGIFRHNSPKMSHSGIIYGVYVSTNFRDEKIGEKLINASLDWAKQNKLISVKLSVVTDNAPAIRLYLKCGFQVYGVEPKVIKVGKDYFDELLMVKIL
jgi:ribosomal protein S18 acetylase RimI-like enzyme